MRNLFLLLFLVLGFIGFGQENNDETSYKNELRWNLTSLLVRNFQFQYERALNNKSALVAGISMIPKGGLPMKSAVEDYVTDDEMGRKVIEDAEMSLFAFTAEYRYYLGKGQTKGFYLGPFYRYNQFEVSQIQLEYEDELLGVTQGFSAHGDVTSSTFGLLLGAKFRLSERVSLDWWILGPHIGFGDGSISGVPDRSMTIIEQQEVREELENIDIPFVDEEVKVDANSAELSFEGNWGGFRSGLCIGFSF